MEDEDEGYYDGEEEEDEMEYDEEDEEEEEDDDDEGQSLYFTANGFMPVPPDTRVGCSQDEPIEIDD